VRSEILHSYIKECHNESEPIPSSSGSPISQPPQEQKSGSDSGTGSQKEEEKSSGQLEPPLPSQEPELKLDPELDQKACDFFRALKDKFEFFRPPEEHVVTREPDNIVKYLHYVEGLNEEESQAIISKWQELGLAQVAQNQIVLIEHAQEGDKNGNDK